MARSGDGSSTAFPFSRQVLARILTWQGQFSRVLGHAGRARELVRQSLALLYGSELADQEPVRFVDEADVPGAEPPFLLQVERILSRAQVANLSGALLLADIDDFRHVNYTYGHETGDRVLAGVASLMQQCSGGSGLFTRWGGEEFVVLLPNTDRQQAVEMAERMRKSVQDHPFESVDGREVRVTISIGIALYPRDAGDIIMLVRFADRAAYLAKRMTKNTVYLYGEYKELIESATTGSKPEDLALLKGYISSRTSVLPGMRLAFPSPARRASALQQMQHIMDRARTANQPVALLGGDIDDLAQVNATYGYQTGNVVLSGVFALMQQCIGESGLLVRWGGEEFVVLLPNTDEQRAVEVAESIRKRVEDHAFASYDGREVRVTISIGIALYPRDAGEIATLTKCADRAAYVAKRRGKNRVCVLGDYEESGQQV